MKTVALSKGLDLPVKGAPEGGIEDGPAPVQVAEIGADYIGLKPKMLVQEGDEVARGTPLFCHKDFPDVMMVAPASGRVSAINRGARRVLQSVVVDVGDPQDPGVDFSTVGAEREGGLVARLCACGLWPSFRTRPYSKIPDPASRPAAIFVTAMDSEPLSIDARLVIEESGAAFARGLEAIASLSEGATYLCQDSGAPLPGADLAGITPVSFTGPHPSGLPGTHIHELHPLRSDEVVWSIWYHDVIAIGHLLETGHLNSERVVALSGPGCARPRLVRTLRGASLDALTSGEAGIEAPMRVISGSVLSGRAAEGAEAYLGRYARQVTLIEEDRKQIPLGWIRPMASKFAVQPVLGSAFSRKLYALTSNLNGGRRAMVPLGTFEELMPQDYLPTQLLRALLVMDTDTAQALGALELDEEDLGLVGFACPAKYEYGAALRDCLEKIEKEG